MLPPAIQEVYEKIKQEILDGAYIQGEPLPEVFLQEKYGIKRTRVRQIIQMLASEGLVEKIPNRGAFIKPITLEDLQEVFEMREALEGMAARLAAMRRKNEELERLIGMFKKYKGSTATKFLREKDALGEQLHKFILDSCGNKRIASTREFLRMQTERVWRMGHSSLERINKSYLAHTEILEALRKQDGDLAEARMREHVNTAFKDYVRIRVLSEPHQQ